MRDVLKLFSHFFAKIFGQFKKTSYFCTHRNNID